MLLNGIFAQVLSDSTPKPSTTLSNQICPKPTFQLGPTEILYPAPPSLSRLSHCQNPNKSDPPKWISVPPRWPCQLSVIVCIHFGFTMFANRSHRDGLPSLCCLIASLRSYRVDAIGATEMRIALSHCTSVHPSCLYRSHRDS